MISFEYLTSVERREVASGEKKSYCEITSNDVNENMDQWKQVQINEKVAKERKQTPEQCFPPIQFSTSLLEISEPTIALTLTIR